MIMQTVVGNVPDSATTVDYIANHLDYSELLADKMGYTYLCSSTCRLGGWIIVSILLCNMVQ